MSKKSKQCQAENCQNEGGRCIVPGGLSDKQDAVYYYCEDHIEGEGFCRGCGIYSAGLDHFEFGRYAGLCQDCGYQARYEDEREQKDREYLDLAPWEIDPYAAE